MSQFLQELQSLCEAHMYLFDAIVVLVAFAIGIAVAFAAKYLLNSLLKQLFFHLAASHESTKPFLALASRIADILPAAILYLLPGAVPALHTEVAVILHRLANILLVIAVSRGLCNILDLTEIWYRRQPNNASRPIKGFLQLLKIFIAVIATILAISSLLDKSPTLLLSGIGAVAAVLMLIFQDTILSMVASIQLNSNNMVKLGDWIALPSHDADGEVIEVALHTVKVQNWDKTIVTIPTRTLINESFINWRGMFESGGRRIKRCLYIDQRSIRFLSDDEIKRLEDFVLLDDYLNQKKQEIEQWNKDLEAKGAKTINSRRITNIGTFRIYVEKYLRSNPRINQNLTLMVRQLAPDVTGLPLEIYCFTQSTKWVEYEQAQADVFDHLLAILPVFDLRVFQECSDIYQECDSVPTFVDVFPQQHLVPPIYPSDKKAMMQNNHDAK